MNHYFLSVVSFLTLLLLSTFVYIGAKRVRFPYTITLVGVGILLGLATTSFPFLTFFTTFTLSPETLLYIFLPILLFESAYNMRYRELVEHARSISLLAVLSLVISALTIAFLLSWILGFFGMHVPFIVLLLFGSLISATDPVSVLALFKEMGAPRRLTLIFEGESLFNDGTALALFLVVLAIAFPGVGGHESVFAHVMVSLEPFLGGALVYVEGVIAFSLMIFLGFLVGGGIGFLFSGIIQTLGGNKMLEIAVTIIVAHFTFLSAEWINHFFFPVSGVIATTIAALVIGNYGKYKLSSEARIMMGEYWEFFAHVANSMVFLLVGVMIVGLNIHYHELLLPISLAILVVIFARAISVYGVLVPFNAMRLERNISLSWMHLLSWGSLRGALAIIMALFIPTDATLPGWTLETSVHDFVLALTVGCIIFTTFVKATTIPLLMRYLQVTALSSEENIDLIEGKTLFLMKIIARIEKASAHGFIREDIRIRLIAPFQSMLDITQTSLRSMRKNDPDATERILHRVLTLHALEIERTALFELFSHNEIGETLFRTMLSKIDSQITRVEDGKSQIKDAFERKELPDLLTRWLTGIEKRIVHSDPIEDQYIKARTRQILTEKVLRQLESMNTIDILSETEALSRVIALYQELHDTASQKRSEIQKDHGAYELEGKLIERMVSSSGTEILEDFCEKGLISSKSAKILEEGFSSFGKG